MINALIVCIFALVLLFNLATFAMAFYAVIQVAKLTERKGYQEILVEFEKVVNEKLQFVSSSTLEPGVYFPQQESITGEKGYVKVSEQSEIERFLNNPVLPTDDYLQELLEVTSNGV